MAFSIKKFISFFLDPFVISFLLFSLAFIFLLFNSYKKAKITLFVSLIFTFIISSSIFSNLLMSPLEQKWKKTDYSELKDIKYALLLGGDFEKRAYEILRLYNNIDNLKIITSGYAGNKKIEEAFSSKEKFVKLGISKDDIITQEKPRDTIEEAQQIKNIVGNERFILVTSASHMPRAMKIFKKQGLEPIAMPTGYMISEKKSESYLGIKELQKLDMAMHEYIGMLWLQIKNSRN